MLASGLVIILLKCRISESVSYDASFKIFMIEYVFLEQIKGVYLYTGGQVLDVLRPLRRGGGRLICGSTYTHYASIYGSQFDQ